MNEENKSRLSTSTIFGFLEFFFELFEDFWSKKEKKNRNIKNTNSENKKEKKLLEEKN